jgi:hypothetical protein
VSAISASFKKLYSFCLTCNKRCWLQLDTRMSQNTSFSSTATKRPPSAENQFLLKDSAPRNGSTPRGTRKSKAWLLRIPLLCYCLLPGMSCRPEEFWICCVLIDASLWKVCTELHVSMKLINFTWSYVSVYIHPCGFFHPLCIFFYLSVFIKWNCTFSLSNSAFFHNTCMYVCMYVRGGP